MFNENVVNEEVVGEAAQTVEEQTPKIVKKVVQTVAKHPGDITKLFKYTVEAVGIVTIAYEGYKGFKYVKGKISDKKNAKDSGDKKPEEA